MLHPRNLLARTIAEGFVWLAVCRYPDLPVVEALAKEVQELGTEEVIPVEQVTYWYSVVGCLDASKFEGSGILDTIVDQIAVSLADSRDSISMDELQQLNTAFELNSR